jgi:hypothetical protein
MSMMSFLPEEDIATIPVEERRALVQSGVLSPNQPGLNTPFLGATTNLPAFGNDQRKPIDTVDSTPKETTSERIARLDREQRDREFAATQAAERAATAQRRENAFGVVNTFLQRAGLQGLEAQIRGLLAQGVEDSDAVLFNLRNTEQFRTRFKANAARAKAGLPELDPATYIGLEQQYRSVLVSNRLPTDFYDSPDDFQKLIEGDVSPSEFQSRINEGFTKVRDADPQVLNTLRQFYPEVGNDDSALAAYFIDPVRANTVLQRQVEAARIGARGREQAGLQVSAATAEDLVRRGYTAEQAQTAFQRAGQLAGLYQEMGGETALTEEQKVGAALGFDMQAQQELERRRAQRVGEFMGGGGFARTSGATSGVVETGVGTAQ